MVDENVAKGPETLSEENLEQVDGGHTGGVNVAMGDGSVRGVSGGVKPGDGSVKGYEARPC